MAEPSCPGCQQRDTVLADLRQRLAALEDQVRDLQAQLGRNASNSSLPPSANPPQAPKPVVKESTGRSPGGQPQHPAHLRERLPPERIQHVVPFVPATCQRCQAPLPATALPGDPEPTWHQVAELPEVTALVTEYQGHARTCPCCGEVTWATIPSEIRAHSIGPNLTGLMSYLSGCHHVSRRGVEEIIETVVAVPVSLGTVAHLEQEVSAALLPAHLAVGEAVRQAEVKNVDETSWRLGAHKCWLWTAATTALAFFVIHPTRGAAGLATLLGTTIYGIICSDRWKVYDRLGVERRQVCWAHLKRDFQKCVDRGGAAAALGTEGRKVVAGLFERWYAFRGGGLDRAGLIHALAPWRRKLHQLLAQGTDCADRKAAAFCANLLALEPALWTFAEVEGVEPTNNHGERVQRAAVLWRKNSYGSRSEAGCLFVERLLTVVQTLRLQKRPVLDYLQQAVRAHRVGLPAPNLLLCD